MWASAIAHSRWGGRWRRAQTRERGRDEKVERDEKKGEARGEGRPMQPGQVFIYKVGTHYFPETKLTNPGSVGLHEGPPTSDCCG